jgi:hypothetical protein
MDGVIEDGIFPSIGDKFFVEPYSGLTVTVGTGRAWFDHTWTYNDTDYNLTHSAADTNYTRIDIVALETNYELAVRANSLKIIKGTAASNPSPPPLSNTSTVKQYPLAYVTIPKNTTTITSDMISNKVGTILCPYVSGPLATIKYEELLYFKVFWNDEDVSSGNGKLFFYVPSYLEGAITDVDMCVITPSTSGLPTVQIANCGSNPGATGTDILSTRITIDVGEYSSYNAATQPVIAYPDINPGDFLRIDVDISGTGTKGLDVFIMVEKQT